MNPAGRRWVSVERMARIFHKGEPRKQHGARPRTVTGPLLPRPEEDAASLSLSLCPARGYYCILVSSSSSASDSLRNRSSRSALAKNNKQFVYARPSLSSPFLSSSPVHEGCGSIRYPNRGLNRRLCGSPARFGSQTIPRETPFDVKRKGRVRETLGCLFSSSFPFFLSPSCFSDSRVYGESEDSMFGGDVVWGGERRGGGVSRKGRSFCYVFNVDCTNGSDCDLIRIILNYSLRIINY